MRRVAAAAKRTVPDCDDASVTVVAQGVLSTPVATGPTALEADRVQYRSGRGPCVDACRRGEMVWIQRLTDDDRYPEFAAQALALGVRSVLSLPLECWDEVHGSLNLYSSRTTGFATSTENVVRPLAARAATVITNPYGPERTREPADPLHARDVIAQARVIATAHHDLEADKALEMLRRASERQNRSLREVAQDIVDRNRASATEPDGRTEQ